MSDRISFGVKALAFYAFISFNKIRKSDAGKAARTDCIMPEGATEDCPDLKTTANFTIVMCSIYIVYMLVIFWIECVHNYVGTGALLGIIENIMAVFENQAQVVDDGYKCEALQTMGYNEEATGLQPATQPSADQDDDQANDDKDDGYNRV